MFSRVKTQERELARAIRRTEGAPINEIARRLRVSKSTVSLWVRDDELTAEQKQALLERNPASNRQYSGLDGVAEFRRRQRVDQQAAIEQHWLDQLALPRQSLRKSL
jgi:transposase